MVEDSSELFQHVTQNLYDTLRQQRVDLVPGRARQWLLARLWRGLLLQFRRALILLDPLCIDGLAGVAKIVDRLVKNALGLLSVLLAEERDDENKLKDLAEQLIFVLGIIEFIGRVQRVLLLVGEVLLRLLAQHAEQALAIQIAIDEELFDLEY